MTHLNVAFREEDLQFHRDYLASMVARKASADHIAWCRRQVRLAKRRLSYAREQVAARREARQVRVVTARGHRSTTECGDSAR